MTWEQQSQISLDLFCYLLRWGMNEGKVLNLDLPGWYFYPLDKRGMHCAGFHTPEDEKSKSVVPYLSHLAGCDSHKYVCLLLRVPWHGQRDDSQIFNKGWGGGLLEVPSPQIQEKVSNVKNVTVNLDKTSLSMLKFLLWSDTLKDSRTAIKHHTFIKLQNMVGHAHHKFPEFQSWNIFARKMTKTVIQLWNSWQLISSELSLFLQIGLCKNVSCLSLKMLSLI